MYLPFLIYDGNSIVTKHRRKQQSLLKKVKNCDITDDQLHPSDICHYFSIKLYLLKQRTYM